MAKNVWHKIEKGSFDKKGKSYDYVIEQNKNTPLDKGGARVRIIKSYPKVKAIRTRYEPHIEVDGEEGAYVPSYFGYNPKGLRSFIVPILLIFITVWTFMLLFFNINIVGNVTSHIPSISMPSGLSIIISWFLKFAIIGVIIFLLVLPTFIKTIKKWKLYYILKNKGLEYNKIA